MASTPLISLEDVTFRFGPNSPYVLQGVNLQLHAGDRICLSGPSGIGKSTLLRIIHGLLQPTEGVVKRAVFSSTPLLAAMMFQDARLLPWRTVLGNVEIGQLRSGDTRGVRRAKAAELLSIIGMNHLRTAFPHQLSGGQKQRVALARALATNAPILLLDEPFSALDHSLRDELRSFISNLAVERGLTLVVVSHDPTDVLALNAKNISISDVNKIEPTKAAANW